MHAITDNTLYYTLSTIAQAGAAIFAFLGAFVLFRLQIANSRLSELASSLVAQIKVTSGPSIIQKLVSPHEYQKTSQSLGIESSSSSNEAAHEFYVKIHAQHEAITRVKRQFLNVMWPALTLIGSSIVALALVDQFVTYAPPSRWLLVMFVGLFVVVLFQMGRVIRACFMD